MESSHSTLQLLDANACQCLHNPGTILHLTTVFSCLAA